MSSESKPVQGRPLRILYLEDRPEDEELVVRELKKSGLQCELERVSHEEAFVRSINSKDYDLVFSDYGLPSWNGLEALKVVRAHRSDLPFILITGTLGEDAAVESIKSGASDYLLKQNLSRLPIAVRRALRERNEQVLRERAEDNLRDSEKHYRLLFDANPNPMWVYDTETMRFLAVNNAAIQQYGFSKSEFLSMTIQGIRPPDEQHRFMAEYEAWDKTENVDAQTWTHARKDGTRITMQISSRAITFRGRPARLVLAVDITEKLRADVERQASELLFSTVFHSSPEGISISTLDGGRYLEANDSFLTIVEYSRDELIGKTILDLGIWSQKDRRAVLFEQLERSNIVIGFEADFQAKTGKTKHVEISAARIQFRDTPCLLAYTRDVTDQELLQKQFQQAQRMESVGRLAAGVAHDFNNLLMVIGSSAELLQGAKSNQTKVERYTEQIRNATDKAASLTRQLLAFSRQQVLQPRVTNFNTVVEDLWKMLPRLLGEDIEMVKALDPLLGNINADPGQIGQVIMNLAVNSRDAMAKGGKLIIETTNVVIDRNYTMKHIGDMKPGAYTMLAVTDTGMGMDAATQARIFEPFFTTKEVGKGTGLGLATVYGVVKQSGGFVWVYSEIGQGTTFKIYLPCVDAQVQSQEPVPPRVALAVTPKTILVAEDEPVLRESIAEYLRSSGYPVLEAGSGPGAVGACETHAGAIDLLITDSVMPGFGGVEVAQAIKRYHSDIRVIFMSGYTDRSMDPAVMGSHSTFMQKPFSLDVLGQTVLKLLE